LVFVRKTMVRIVRLVGTKEELHVKRTPFRDEKMDAVQTKKRTPNLSSIPI